MCEGLVSSFEFRVSSCQFRVSEKMKLFKKHRRSLEYEVFLPSETAYMTLHGNTSFDLWYASVDSIYAQRDFFHFE